MKKRLISRLLIYTVLTAAAVFAGWRVEAQSPYSVNIFKPATVMTATSQTSAAIPLGTVATVPKSGSYAAGNIQLTGSSLTTATFGVTASSDNGTTYFAVPICTVAATPVCATTQTATANAIFTINLGGLTHIKFVTSGTFTATSISLLLTASPNAQAKGSSSGGGSGATLPFPGIVFATSASGGRIATGIDEAIAAATPGDLSNVFMGTVAAPKPGNDNVALGNQACQSLNFGATTAATNALGNVCIGWHAGQNLTTGNFNILIGNQAGIALTGTGNPVDDTIIIAIGAGALQNAVSTSPASGEGVFIGEDAGSGILHTGFDVVVGNHALTPQNGTTNENVVLGINAMATDGGSGYTISDDVIIGREAATGAQSNSANVIIGQTAGIAVTTPVSDVIIGQAAAPNYTTGGSNVVVGQDAAPNMTTGSANVAIGQEAAFSLTTGTGNVGIGQFSMTDHGNANIEMGAFSGGGSASSNNVAIGSGAGNGMTGGNNTSVGISAHNAGTSGNGTENLLLGHNAQINQNISNAVQLGAGTNPVSGSAQIFNIPILGTTTFTATGCTNSTLVGGSTAGSYHSGTTGICTVVITTGLTAPNGWACFANDLTTTADTIKQTASSATTATLAGTTVTGDVINFGCMAY